MKKRMTALFILVSMLLSMVAFAGAEVITDVTGPTITDAVCDKQGQSLKAGDVVRFSFKAQDESGLRDGISVNFYEATSYKGRQFEWTYNPTAGKYETTFVVPEGLKNGEYYISTIYVYDNYGNQCAKSVHLGFFVEDGISDVTGPTITDAVCDKQGQSLKPGDVVRFSFKAQDESGLRDGISVNFYEATSYKGRQFDWSYHEEADTFESTFVIPDSVQIGEYYISTIYIYDIHGNQCAKSVRLGFFVELDGHAFGDWSVVQQPTCEEPGIEQRECTVCNYIESREGESLSPTGHRWKDGFCTLCRKEDPTYVPDTPDISDEPDRPDSSNPFSDVKESDYFFAPVLWAVQNNVTTGTSATTFSPNATCTRGQVVTFLWRANGEPEPASERNPFVDVSSEDYFYKAVLWAVENGITTGLDTTRFGADDPCTRAQVVTFLWRVNGQPEPEWDCWFRDVDQDAYFFDALSWAVEQEITSGTSDTTFSPNDPCTRGQIVTFLQRAAFPDWLVGTWSASPDEAILIEEDGSMTIEGVRYPKEVIQYWFSENGASAYIESAEGSFTGFYDISMGKSGEMYVIGADQYGPYAKDRTWTAVPLTPENFFDYYEYQETFTIHMDVFDEFDRAYLARDYVLKEDKLQNLDAKISSAAVKVQSDSVLLNYTIDMDCQTYTITGEEWDPDDEPHVRVCEASPWAEDDLKISLGGDTFWDPAGEVWSEQNLELLNITGTLYYINH